MASFVHELKLLADAQKLSALGYLPDLVRIEAEEQARYESDHKVA